MTWALAALIGGAIALKAAVENRSFGDVLRGVFTSAGMGPGERGFQTDLLAGVLTPGGGGGSDGGAPAPTTRGGGRGRVTLAPGADRAGVKTKSCVLRFVQKASGILGQPLTIGTGSNHSQMTVSGNVSDHWTGNAADIPATGDQLIRIGQALLIAAGMSERQARQQRGGLYNVGGHQIIFNTQDGGDHTDHAHASAEC